MKALTLFAVLFLFAASSLAQSLGDVARQQRQKQQAKPSATPRKVITDEDLPDRAADASDSTAGAGDKGKSSSSTPAGGKKTAEQWKSQIQSQKAKVAAMQSEVDKLSGSVHYVEANRYWNGVQYNQAQQKKQQEAERLQKQLDEQKKALSDMQEACRRAGFGSSVYEP